MSLDIGFGTRLRIGEGAGGKACMHAVEIPWRLWRQAHDVGKESDIIFRCQLTQVRWLCPQRAGSVTNKVLSCEHYNNISATYQVRTSKQ